MKFIKRFFDDWTKWFFFRITWIAGRAVFAGKNFHKGDFLLWYKGILLDAAEAEKWEEREESVFRYFFKWMGKKWW